ncbi:MAG TPA: hypothetical protein VN496_06415 [Burkholderiales bacterium]|nr:hypothetical protein [Burkholderiales bacterium]
MKFAGVLLGLIVLAGVLIVWFRAYKSIKSDQALSPSGKGAPKQKKDSLDDFIASYKRGEVSLENNTKVLPSPAAPGTPAANSVLSPPFTPPAPAAIAAAAVDAGPIKCESFLAGATKLAYLTAKTGLRDHHIFAHVQLAALSTGAPLAEPLSHASVDLVICNAALAPVAAIDLIDAASGPAPVAKSEHLRMLGVRYLRLSVKSLPKPDEWHTLLYKM